MSLSRKTLRIGAIIIVIIAAVIFSTKKNTVKTQSLPGYIEANLTYISTNGTSGTLQHLYVHRGEKVSTGQALFTLDSTPYQLQHQADHYQAMASTANYRNLLSGKRQPFIEQTKAQIAQTKANLVYQQRNYLRLKKLYHHGAISAQSYEQTQSQYQQTLQQFHSLQAQLRIDKLEARQAQISNAAANAKASNEQQKLSAWKLAQTRVNSPSNATVFDTYYEPGEQVSSAHPVVSLLIKNHLRLVFYITEQQLSRIHLGQRIYFATDGSSQLSRAQISYISTQAEYTPPIIYSKSTRQDLSYKIEAKALNNLSNWHPGQPVSVSLSKP